ncbi:MAG: hypothetical protein ACREJC_03945 [Tepidisphaeraceae bacterium]
MRVVPVEAELAWAAGLFVGEGNVGRTYAHKPNRSYEYLHIQLGMRDQRSVSRFARVFGFSCRPIFLKKRGYDFFKVQVRGRNAERALALMWPYIEGTDKGDQTLRYASRLGLEDWITGEKTGNRPQLNLTKRGRKA